MTNAQALRLIKSVIDLTEAVSALIDHAVPLQDRVRRLENKAVFPGPVPDDKVALFHRLWGKAVGTAEYKKSDWQALRTWIETLTRSPL